MCIQKKQLNQPKFIKKKKKKTKTIAENQLTTNWSPFPPFWKELRLNKKLKKKKNNHQYRLCQPRPQTCRSLCSLRKKRKKRKLFRPTASACQPRPQCPQYLLFGMGEQFVFFLNFNFFYSTYFFYSATKVPNFSSCLIKKEKSPRSRFSPYSNQEKKKLEPCTRTMGPYVC
jgi:hypothetical protein